MEEKEKEEIESGIGQKQTEEKLLHNQKRQEETQNKLKMDRLAQSVETPLWEDGFLYHGEYPQKKVDDPVLLAKLENATTPTYGLYLSLDGFRLARYNGEWFYVTPIAWKILSQEGKECLVVSHDLLDARRFDPSSGDYRNSELWKWLHEHFLSHAFPRRDFLLKLRIEKGLVQFKDDIALLSEKEVTNPNYGFSDEESRRASLTDYASCRCKLIEEDGYWLRPQRSMKGDQVPILDEKGKLSASSSVNPLLGVRPLLKIRLP